MKRSPLSARRVLVVAPHPDDEAIGAWALMRLLARRGARIDVVVVADGAASHPRSVRWPASRLVPERRRETRRAMATLAIRPDRIRFLALPDGALDRPQSGVDGAVARAFRRRPAPDLVVGPVLDDAHADHRAVARAIARVPRRGEHRIGYQVWPGQMRRSSAVVRVTLDGRALCAKRRVVRGYRTQTGIITDADAGFAMTWRHLRTFVTPVERFGVAW